MEGPGPGGGGKGGQVLGGHTGPHKDLQLRPGGLYQPLQQSCSLRGAGSLAAGKDGGKAQSPGSLQCGKGVPAGVPFTLYTTLASTGKRDWVSISPLNEETGKLFVTTISVESPSVGKQ